jgi:hypothetical protein
MDNLGYHFKGIDTSCTTKAYADDLNLTASTPKQAQALLDKADTWLTWTDTMNAKPKKCICMALKKFDKRAKSELYSPVNPTNYSPFDPQLTISGKRMKFIQDPEQKDPFKSNHFKFLGDWLNADLNDEAVKLKIKNQFFSLMKTVDKSLVNGPMKLWLYQFMVLPMISWPFLIQNVNLNFIVKALQSRTGVYLKRWAHIYKSADVGVLYRAQTRFGLGLTSLSLHFKKMQVIKCHLLQHSIDKNIVSIFNHQTASEVSHAKKWQPTKFLTKVMSMVDLDLKFPSQTDRRGLGSGRYRANTPAKEIRKLCGAAATKLEEDCYEAHTIGLPLQGVWLQWSNSSLPFDLSWKNLIYGPGPKLLAFVINASINCLPTPDMLRLWGYRKTAPCFLCQHPQCTNHHILSNCSKALKDKRYTWRHDSVLLTLQPILDNLIHKQNSSHKITPSHPHISSNFISSTPSINQKPQPPIYLATAISVKCSRRKASIAFQSANDWKLLIDFDHERITFPPEVCATNQRPDIIIYSKKTQVILLIELTCPADEGIAAAKNRKIARYIPLIELIKSSTNNHWTPHLLTIESGARGFVAKSMANFLKTLRASPHHFRQSCRAISLTTVRCSYSIFLSRSTVSWDAKRDLIHQQDITESNREQISKRQAKADQETARIELNRAKAIQRREVKKRMKKRINRNRSAAIRRLEKKKQLNRKHQKENMNKSNKARTKRNEIAQVTKPKASPPRAAKSSIDDYPSHLDLPPDYDEQYPNLDDEFEIELELELDRTHFHNF